MTNIYSTLFLLVALILGIENTNAQQITSLDSYRSESNSDYWGNRLPTKDYWQQDVHYTIKAKLKENSDVLSGLVNLHYRNNSPDTLFVVYFHLYQNAFTPDSYMDKMNARRSYERPYGHYEKEGLGTVVDYVLMGTDKLKMSVDNTLMKVELAEPLAPHEEVHLHMHFSTYFERNGAWRRMKCWSHAGGVHYNGAHWYPRVAVYDTKFGWNLDQHLGHEFYGEFGIYDVALDMPNNQIVTATGILQNRLHMMPKKLADKVKIENYAKPVAKDSISIAVPYEKGVRKVWKYHAENVHDFAFVADPSFRIGHREVVLSSGKKVDCWSFAMEENAHKWQDAADISAETIEVFSEGIGEYAYPKIIVVDARAGMEYPMLTMDGGGSPEYAHLLIHEIGHNWFFGAVGSNETYRALLDEGFTQYLTVYGMEALAKKRDIGINTNDFASKYAYNQSIRYNVVYKRYLENTIKEGGECLNTHSDYFNGDHPYGNEHRQVYYKTAAMLYNLQLVLGDKLFEEALRNYFSQWKFAHPYDEDLRASFIHFTRVDLNWFFDQWLNTKKNIDYRICSVKRDKKTDQVKIVFERRGEMQMPLDFNVVTSDGKVHCYHIPNKEFVKETDAIVLKSWVGWDELNTKYEAVLPLEQEVYRVEIDTSMRLADVNRVDNAYPRSVGFVMDMGVEQPDVWDHYRIYTRPDLWYNGYDGVKLGLRMQGSYMNYKHIVDFSFWLNSGVGSYANSEMTKRTLFNQAAIRFSYKTATDNFIPYSYIQAKAQYLEGLQDFSLSFVKENKARNQSFYLRLRSFFRQDTVGMNYLIYPNEWGFATEENPGIQYNNTIQIGYRKKRKNFESHIYLKNSALLSSYSFTQLTSETKWNTKMHKFLWKSRFFGQEAFGERIPIESQLYLAGASPEEMMNNKYMRSYGFFPQQEFGNTTGHIHYGGGLNLRGYAGYLAPVNLDGKQYFAYRSNIGFAYNTELEFDQYIPLRIRRLQKYMNLNTYLFADAGLMFFQESNLLPSDEKIDFRADAGLGFALNIHTWGPLSKAKPLTIRFDIPLYLSDVPYVDGMDYTFRWVLGVNRAF